MPTIALRFPGRRYQATPWGHHVNEGLVEWPPSPWRLLRALLATGYTKLGWVEGAIPAEGIGLLEKLAGVTPEFELPPSAGVAHSRHYMPAPVKTTLVFDTWAQVDDGPLLVRWGVELRPGEHALLATLVERLSYLGRAESWVEARVVSDGEVQASAFETAACRPSELRGPGWEQVSVLAPLPPAEYAGWRAEQVERALASVSVAASGKKPSAKTAAKHAEQQADAVAPYPVDLVACLGVETGWLQVQGWSQPPGAQRVLYWRRRDALEVAPPRPPSRSEAAPVEAVLLALSTQTRGRGALPPLTRTFPQALRLHAALAALARVEVGEETRRCLLGKERSGEPTASGHGHAHLLPLHLDPCGDGKVDHVLVWAPSGLDGGAQRILRRLRRLERTGPTDSAGELDRYLIAIAAEGSLDLLASVGEPLRAGLLRALGRSGREPGRRWASVTPFFAPRFLKPRGRNTLEGQLRAELAARGLPPLRSFRVLDRDQVVKARFLHYVRRARRKAPKVDSPLGLEIELETPLDRPAPLCLGFGSHFGLGRFEPV